MWIELRWPIGICELPDGIDPIDNRAEFIFNYFLSKRRRIALHQIVIYMAHLNHTLIVRVTERQLRFLTDVLLDENRSKSQVLREAINLYLVEKSSRNASTEPTKEQPRKVR
jgi:hypothetical protein